MVRSGATAAPQAHGAALRQAPLRRLAEARSALRLAQLLQLWSDEELARLCELRRQVRQGERSEF